MTAAFGDNLDDTAQHAAQALQLSNAELHQLRQLGVAINYNAYGECVEDLHIPPNDLYRLLSGYPSPFDFIADNPMICQAAV